MKLSRICFCVMVLVCTNVARSQPISGDVSFWIPFSTVANAKDLQIVRNSQYISIRIARAHVSYRSGFLENIRKIVVNSSVSFDIDKQRVQALTINLTWQRSSGKAEEDLPVQDLLAVLSPAASDRIAIKVGFSGIGKNVFKGVFDVLADPQIKTALDLSPARVAQMGLATSIVQRFLASPYTDSDPKNVLSMSSGFVIYADKTEFRNDSLKQGYFVIISGTEKKNADLRRVVEAAFDEIRFNPERNVLQLRQADGTWGLFTGNSYVVLSVTASPVRGIDENSEWFRKFAEAKRTTERLEIDEPLEAVKKDTLALWREGVTLLSADPNYIETERKSIRLKELSELQDEFSRHGIPQAQANLAAEVPGTPPNLSQEVRTYAIQLQELRKSQEVVIAGAESLTVQVTDAENVPLPGITVTLTGKNGYRQQAVTDERGIAHFRSLNAGTYSIIAELQGFKRREMTNVQVPSGQSLTVTLKFETRLPSAESRNSAQHVDY